MLKVRRYTVNIKKKKKKKKEGNTSLCPNFMIPRSGT